MIQIRRNPNERLLELGGGANPKVNPTCRGGHDVAVDVRMCYDEQGNPTVDFTADFDEPLPIGSDEFDNVICIYCIEHVTWRKIPQFISEMFRVIKPGGKAVVVSPNTEAQMEWIKNNPNGWDNKNVFESASCILYGDQDYSDNTHKGFMSPTIAMQLFQAAGFENIIIKPHGARDTDMSIVADKPVKVSNAGKVIESPLAVPKKPITEMTREEMYDKHYFHGGAKVGGYAAEGYWDYPVHNVSAAHILMRKPKSVLEVGCARGYILKRIQDAGIPGHGLEISKHCNMTRVCDPITQWDICTVPWPFQNGDKFDLCYSLAFLEHIPEEHLPAIIGEMARVSERGLHGIDFGGKDDGFDKTHCTLRPKEWWDAAFAAYAPNWPVEIVDKEELERGSQPFEMSLNDGLVKVNVGSYINMFHHNWLNVDIHDLNGFAQHHGYRFQQCDIKNGMPFLQTGTVHMIYCSHCFEHLSYEEGKSFLRECRRVIKSGGLMRFLVPDAGYLMDAYLTGDLSKYSEISDGVEKAPTDLMRLWELLMSGHHSMYDVKTMVKVMEEVGFQCKSVNFRESINPKMLRETIDMLPEISLIVECTPA